MVCLMARHSPRGVLMIASSDTGTPCFSANAVARTGRLADIVECNRLRRTNNFLE